MAFRICLVVCCTVCSLSGSAAHGQLLPFYDDFDDMNATDGKPGTWLPGGEPGGTRDASSGDFVVTHTTSSSTSVEELRGLKDLSIETQVRIIQLSGNRDAGVVWARSEAGGGVYWGAIDSEGLLAIGYVPPIGDNQFLNSTSTSLDPVTKDVRLQFDVFGDRLALTAWQDGDAKPISPQLTAIDDRQQVGGGVGLTLVPNLDGGSAPAAVVFRYYSVVPEPSSLGLAGMATLGALGLARLRRIPDSDSTS